MTEDVSNEGIDVQRMLILHRIDNSIVLLVKVVLAVINGISSIRTVKLARMRLSTARISDVKFVDDKHLMLATAGEGQSPLFK